MGAGQVQRSRYKTLLRDEFRRHGIDPPSGGVEYGDEIARVLDTTVAGSRQASLRICLDDLAQAIRQMRASNL